MGASAHGSMDDDTGLTPAMMSDAACCDGRFRWKEWGDLRLLFAGMILSVETNLEARRILTLGPTFYSGIDADTNTP